MSDGRVSVIIPAYNAAQYLDAAIASVDRETWPDLELIVVDDGSTDETAQKAAAWKERFKEKGRTLCLVGKKNGGAASAVSAGLVYVTGEYLCLLDADDEFLDGAITLRASYLADHPELSAVRSDGYVVNGDAKWLFTAGEEVSRSRKAGALTADNVDLREAAGLEESGDQLFERLLRGKTYNWAGSYMVRTDVLFDFYEDRQIPVYEGGQNLQILLPCVYRKRVGFIDKPLMKYIKREASFSAAGQTDPKGKELRNADAYALIRRGMIERIIPETERKPYLQMAEESHLRARLDIETRYGDKAAAKEVLTALRKMGAASLEDELRYDAAFDRPKYLLCRIRRKLGR